MHVYLELSALEGGDRSGDRAARERLVLHDIRRRPYSTIAVKAMEKARIRNNILSHLWDQSLPKKCSPTHEGKNKNNSSSVFLSLSVFFPPSLESFLTFRIGATPDGFPMRENRAEYPGQTGCQTPLSTDGPPPRHCIIAGASHVTQLDTRVAFMGCGWKKAPLTTQKHTHTRTYARTDRAQTHTHTPQL